MEIKPHTARASRSLGRTPNWAARSRSVLYLLLLYAMHCRYGDQTQQAVSHVPPRGLGMEGG